MLCQLYSPFIFFHRVILWLICFTTFASLRQMRMSFLCASVGYCSNRLSGSPLQSVTHPCEKSKETGAMYRNVVKYLVPLHVMMSTSSLMCLLPMLSRKECSGGLKSCFMLYRLSFHFISFCYWYFEKPKINKYWIAIREFRVINKSLDNRLWSHVRYFHSSPGINPHI